MEIDRTGDAGHLFHLVLYADPKFSEAYLMDVLTQRLFLSPEAAVARLADLAVKGRAVLMTCARADADFAYDQLTKYIRDVPPSRPVRLAVERVYARPN